MKGCEAQARAGACYICWRLCYCERCRDRTALLIRGARAHSVGTRRGAAVVRGRTDLIVDVWIDGSDLELEESSENKGERHIVTTLTMAACAACRTCRDNSPCRRRTRDRSEALGDQDGLMSGNSIAQQFLEMFDVPIFN